MRELVLFVGACFLVGMWCYAIYVSLYLAGKRDELTRTWMIVGFVPLVVGYLIDVALFNWIIATIVYREWPKERTFTARVTRHYRSFVFWNGKRDYRLHFTHYWVRQLNALTPSEFEHVHNHDRK